MVLLTLSVTFFRTGDDRWWIRVPALFMVSAGSVVLAAVWNPLLGPYQVFVALAGTGALVLALVEVRVALQIVLGGSLASLLGGLIAGAPGALCAAALFGSSAVAVAVRRARYGHFVADDEAISLRSRARSSAVQDAMAQVLDDQILSPSLWRFAALGRRFAWHRDHFLAACREAFLVKQSGGDWEFTHRLLRDYFALRQLRPGLVASNPEGRLDAIRSLGFQGEAALDTLGEFSKDDDPATRAAALVGLSHIASPEVPLHFHRLAGDRHPLVRRALIAGHARLPLKDQIALLQSVEPLGDGCEVEPLFETMPLHEQQLQLFRRLGRQAVEPLRARLRGTNSYVRQRAVGVLAQFADELDRRLLSEDLVGEFFWIDPAKPIDKARVAFCAAKLSWSQDAVLARYRALAEEFALKIKV